MKKIYKVPMKGTVIGDNPLKGAPDDVICPISLLEIMREHGKEGIEGYSSLEYNIDEGWVEVEVRGTPEGHAWLESMLPELGRIKNEKGWVLKNPFKKVADDK